MTTNTVTSAQAGAAAEQQEETINFRQILDVCVVILQRHWMWFLASMVVCVALAYVFCQTRPQVFQHTAVLEIEDASGAGSINRRANNATNMLLELNGVSVGNSLEDETFILQTYRLMERVVMRLGLGRVIRHQRRPAPRFAFQCPPV